MIIDSKGRLFSKISVIDIMVVIAVIGLCIGLAFKIFSKETTQIINANQTFYATFAIERVRDFSVEAINVGDVFFEQFGNELGKVTKVTTETAYDVMKKDDGTALYAPMEDRYNLYFTLECKGNVNPTGYFVGGSKQLSVGSELKMKSNMVLSSGKVYKLSETSD